MFQPPKPLVETELIHVTAESDVTALLERLLSCDVIAVDLEHHSFRSYLGLTCLMQISTRDCDFIVDTLALRTHLQPLNRVFTDPNIVKVTLIDSNGDTLAQVAMLSLSVLQVFHGAMEDVRWMQRDLSLYLVNLFDTHEASYPLEFERHSLAHLLQHYCGVTTNKKFQLADWRIR